MASPELYETLSETINYIEHNLRNKLTLDDIAAHTFLSKFHLHRIFKKLTRESLMDYVKSRQLSSSLIDLLQTDLRVADIAQEYGFEHHQSFIRSFKNEFGITPTEFRESLMAIKVKDKLTLDDCKAVDKGIIIQPDIIIKPSFSVVGIKHTVYMEDNNLNRTANKLGKDFFYNHRRRIKNAVNPNVYIGLTRLPDTMKAYTCYMPCLEVSGLDNIPEGMQSDTISSQKYAVFKYIGLHHPDEISTKTLEDIWCYIFGTWMPRMDLRNGERMSFESIDNSVSTDNYCEVDLYYPICKL